MGTKSHLAPLVAGIASELRPGVFFDAFAGMCSVGQALADRRRVWASDRQRFAALVAEAVLTFRSGPDPRASCNILKAAERIIKNSARRYADLIAAERSALACASKRAQLASLKSLDTLLASRSNHFAANSVFLRNYSNSYFSVSQAMEIDALMQSVQEYKSDSYYSAESTWLVIAVGVAAYKVACTTGHFAQYLTPSLSNIRRIARQREKSLLQETSRLLLSLRPHAHATKHNRAICGDSLEELVKMRGQTITPSVVYADPPYTEDQYSRYYHILDSLVDFKPHEVKGKGRYPEGRFSGQFSKKSVVADAFRSLATNSAAIGADLILSYPSNGILYEVGATPGSILREHYKDVKIAAYRSVQHSTFGASKGASTAPAREQLFVARGAR